MATTFEQIAAIFEEAGIRFEHDDAKTVMRTAWLRGEVPVVLLVLLLEDGELVQLRTPSLLHSTDDAGKPLLFRAMLQMAYETRLVQFEYDPGDGEVSTCIDIALEDAALSKEQLLRCCSLLLDVSYRARDRLRTILETGLDPALEEEGVDREEAKQRQSQLDAMVEVARRMRSSSRGDA
jgi:hypothetical protein